MSVAQQPDIQAAEHDKSLTAGQPILEVEHLRKIFPLPRKNPFGAAVGVHAVEDTSLILRRGRAIALVGESGSGKTTVARVLAGLYPATSGTITFNGQHIGTLRGEQLKAYHHQVQYVFQDPFGSLNPHHSVRYHLSRPLRIFGQARNQDEETEQVLALLQRVSLTPAEQFIHKYPHELSGGQRQRIAIARTLAAKPTVLLADEPVSMLDVSIRLDVLNLLLRLKDDDHLALLYITHDIASARYFADETMVMYAGQSVEGGPSDGVIQRPRHPYTQLLLSAVPDAERADAPAPLAAKGEPPSLIHPPTGCRFHLRCPHAMPICRQQVPSRTDFGNSHWARCFLYEAAQQGGDLPEARPTTVSSVTTPKEIA